MIWTAGCASERCCGAERERRLVPTAPFFCLAFFGIFFSFSLSTVRTADLTTLDIDAGFIAGGRCDGLTKSSDETPGFLAMRAEALATRRSCLLLRRFVF